MLELLYQDDRIVACVKPAGIISTDEPGGLPDLVREALGDPQAVVRTVHRLDQVVSGVMVLARTARAAADLSAQIRSGAFQKEYLAVCFGEMPDRGKLENLLLRDAAARTTRIVDAPGKNVQRAELVYETLSRYEQTSLVRIRLLTGRTHQIRVQFAGCGHPLLGDRKYGREDGCEGIGLWSHRIVCYHPRTGRQLCFAAIPSAEGAWRPYSGILSKLPVDFSVENRYNQA